MISRAGHETGNSMNAPGAQANFGMSAPAWFCFPALRRWQLDGKQTAMLAGILLATALVYLRCFGNGFVYDDYPTIVNNHYLRQSSFLWKSVTHDLWWFRDPKHLPQSAYYRPLQNISIALCYRVVGTHPLGWHILKILLHLGVVALVFRLALLLTKSTSAALLAALLFGVLPVHAESVVWATAIPEPLSAIFELAAFCLFIQRDRTRWRGLACSLILFACATLSHESAVVFPLLIAAYVFLFETHAGEAIFALPTGSPHLLNRAANAIARSAPFFGIALLYFGARGLVLGTSWILGFTHYATTAAMVQATLVIRHTNADHSLGQLLMTVPGVLACYLEVLTIPWLAGPAHDVDFVTEPGVRTFYFPLAILVTVTALGYAAFRRSPHRKLYLFCAVWRIVTFLPALNLEQIVALVQDRYEYLPSFGFCVFVGDWAVRVAPSSAFRARVIGATATVLIVAYLAGLWHAEPFWRDDIAMFGRCVEMAPDLPRCHAGLAGALTGRGDYNGAAHELLLESKLTPGDPAVYLSLAMIYMKLHRGTDATKELEAYYRAVFNTKKVVKKPRWYVEFK